MFQHSPEDFHASWIILVVVFFILIIMYEAYAYSNK